MPTRMINVENVSATKSVFSLGSGVATVTIGAIALSDIAALVGIVVSLVSVGHLVWKWSIEFKDRRRRLAAPTLDLEKKD